MDSPTCRAALREGSTELGKLLLGGLMAGAMWTAARLLGHGMPTKSARPHCGTAHKDDVHILWDCPEWDDARGAWRPRLTGPAEAIPHL